MLIGLIDRLKKPSNEYSEMLDTFIGVPLRVFLQAVSYCFVQTLAFNNDNLEEDLYKESLLCLAIWIALVLMCLLNPLKTISLTK